MEIHLITKFNSSHPPAVFNQQINYLLHKFDKVRQPTRIKSYKNSFMNLSKTSAIAIRSNFVRIVSSNFYHVILQVILNFPP